MRTLRCDQCGIIGACHALPKEGIVCIDTWAAVTAESGDFLFDFHFCDGCKMKGEEYSTALIRKHQLETNQALS